jgi:hypothetical protein
MFIVVILDDKDDTIQDQRIMHDDIILIDVIGSDKSHRQ